MANTVRGEVTFDANGKLYTFKLGTNAQVMLEDRVGMSVQKYMQSKGENLGAADIRLIFYCALFQKHELTELEVGDLIDEIGAGRAAEIFLAAVEAATAKKPNGAATDARPQKQAKEPIGMNS